MTDWISVGVRFALYLDLSLLFGLAAFGLHSLRGAHRRSGEVVAFRLWLGALAALGILLSAAGLWVIAAAMAGVTLGAVDRATIEMILDGTAIGTAFKGRVGLLVVASIVAAGRRWPAARLVAVTILSGIALATLAWNGHGAMDDARRGIVHLIADIAHLIAAGLWIGALLGLGLLLGRHEVDAGHLSLSHRALQGFAVVGSIIVATVLASGLVNAWLLVGPENAGALLTTLYGQLLLAKIALFLIMLALAAANRYRLTPAFEKALTEGDHPRALGTLRRSLGVETACAVVILGLVALLGTLAPPASGM